MHPQPERILVRSPNWIGDQVMAYPFFHFLRKAHPTAQIAAVCVDWVADIQFRGLVDEVIQLPKPPTQDLRERFGAIEAGADLLRTAGRWDVAYSLPNSLSTAWLLYRARCQRRRGYRNEGRGLLLNEGLPWVEGKHRAQAYVNLLTEKHRPSRDVREFWGVPPENELDPGISGELSKFDAAKNWPTKELQSPPDEPYWVLAPGATADSRRWPSARFAALARIIQAETGFRGVVVGGPKEAPLAEELCSEPGLKLKDMCGKGPIPSLTKVFSGAKLTLTNDSGLAHVAALCGSLTQVVWGAGDLRRTRPLGPGRVQVTINPVECWPCERNVCYQPPERKLACLNGIAPEAVWEEIKRGLRLNQVQ